MFFKLCVLVTAAAGIAMGLAACSSPEDREARYIARGTKFMAENRLAEAALEFRNAERLRPSDPVPVYQTGLVLEARGDLLEAYKTFLAASNQDRHFTPSALKLAKYMITGNALEGAGERIESVLTLNPRNAEAHALRANLFYQQHDSVVADREAQQALALDPANLTAQSVLIRIYADRGESTALLRMLRDAELAHPRELGLRELAIEVFTQLGDDKAIERAYLDLLTLHPEGKVRSAFAAFYGGEGRVEEGEQVLRGGVAAAPGDVGKRRDLVAYLDRFRGGDAAASEIRAFIAGDPTEVSYPFWLASLYTAHGNTDAAAKVLLGIYRDAPIAGVKARAEAMLARIALVKGLPAEAEGLAAKALTIKPDDAEAILVSAQVDLLRGQFQHASTILREVAHQEPSNAEAQQLLAESLLREGHPDLAADTLSTLLSYVPRNKTALIRLAQMDHLLGAEDRAIDLLATVTRIWPSEPLGWESTARIAVDDSDWPKAEQAISQLAGLPGQAQLVELLRAMEQAGQGRPAKALPLLADMVRKNPGTGAAKRGVELIILIERSRGACGDAIAVLSSLPVVSPVAAEGIGSCEIALGHTDAAAQALDAAISGGVQEQEAYIERAQIDVHTGHTKEALAVLASGARILPTANAVRVMQADLTLASGDYGAAMQIYDDLLRRNPGLDEAANNLASLIADHDYGDSDALNKARMLADRFRNSNDPHELDTIGWVYYRRGEITDALSIFERAAKVGKLTNAMRYHYGKVLLAAGRQSDARSLLASSVAAGADFFGRDDAQRTLATL